MDNQRTTEEAMDVPEDLTSPEEEQNDEASSVSKISENLMAERQLPWRATIPEIAIPKRMLEEDLTKSGEEDCSGCKRGSCNNSSSEEDKARKCSTGSKSKSAGT